MIMEPCTIEHRPPAELFRDVIGRFASGVTVITTQRLGLPHGTTASAVSSLSLDPPMVLVCMNQTSATGQAVSETGRFAVNVLGAAQADMARRFAGKGANKFDRVSLRYGAGGLPLLPDALATLECRVVEETVGGTHTVFLAQVEQAIGGHGAPLVYFRGRFTELDARAGWSGQEA